MPPRSGEQRRLFIGSELPASVAEGLTGVQEGLRQERFALRLEPVALMHLTLCFLGETDSTAVPHLAALLHDLCAAEPPFDLRLGTVGAFPHLAAPRVVWVGLEGETDALIRLAGFISSAVAPFRAAPESRPFHPHITIGRTRGRATYAERQLVGRSLHGMPAAPPVAWTVDRVVLFESRMAAGERSYLALATAGLGEGTAGPV